MKKKKVQKVINRIMTGIMIIVLVGVASIVFVSKASGGEPEVLGYQIKTVLSGSMEPDIQTGSIIAVKKVEDKMNFKQGDVITFRENDEGIFITHRITEVVKSGESVLYRTKGDSNNGEDLNPVLSENVVGQYTGFTIAKAGYLVSFAQSKNGAFFLLIPGFLLLIYSAFTVWEAVSQIELTTKKQTDV